MKFVKGAPLFFCLLILLSVHLYTDQDNSNSFTLDTIRNEYGSLINYLEYYPDKDASKSLDELPDRGRVKFWQLDEEVILDKNYFFRIVENPVSNAIKCSPLGKYVFVKTYGLNEKAGIEIKDEGPGFNSADKKNIFRKFQQLSAKPTGGESTTGLCLSIV